MENDFGADRVWRVALNFVATNKPLADRIAAALAPTGIVADPDPGGDGAYIQAIAKAQKLAIVDLNQDGTCYFDLHHTPNDTLDKIDPAQLEQNVAAWTRVLEIVANEPGPLTAD
jgi:hypothetical protein